MTEEIIIIVIVVFHQLSNSLYSFNSTPIYELVMMHETLRIGGLLHKNMVADVSRTA